MPDDKPAVTAFISDLHSNLTTLEAVLANVETRNVTRTVCLGDAINYGPDPAEVLRIVRKLDLCLMGNHEEGVLYEPIGFNPMAVAAAKWTRSVLHPSLFSDGRKWANWKFIMDRPIRHQEDGILMVHASPREPTSEYLLPSDGEPILGEISDKLKECFQLVEHLCFVGHTHIPGVFTETAGFTTPDELDHEYRVESGVKAIINVGSTGQPRDHNPDAAYATFDGEVVRFHRVPYDVQATVDRINAIGELPERCGTRLLEGI